MTEKQKNVENLFLLVLMEENIQYNIYLLKMCLKSKYRLIRGESSAR